MTKKRTEQLIKTIRSNFGETLYMLDLGIKYEEEEGVIMNTALYEAVTCTCSGGVQYRKARDLISLSLLYSELNSDTLDNK